MRRDEIAVGRTYAGGTGPRRKVYRLFDNPRLMDRRCVDYAMLRRKHEELRTCTLTSFALWAKEDVTDAQP